MNKYVSGALIFVAGAGIGFGVSWFIINKKIFELRLEEELNKNEEYYLDLEHRLGLYFNDDYEDEESEEPFEDDESPFPEPEEEPKEKRTMNYTEKMNLRKEKLIHKGKIAYDRISIVSDDETKEVDEAQLVVNNDNPRNDILIITPEQFGRERLGYDKETFYWWASNHLMTTEDGDILNVPDLIGNEWEDRIGEFEKDTVYVRNNGAESDYQIIQQSEDYYDYYDR